MKKVKITLKMTGYSFYADQIGHEISYKGRAGHQMCHIEYFLEEVFKIEDADKQNELEDMAEISFKEMR